MLPNRKDQKNWHILSADNLTYFSINNRLIVILIPALLIAGLILAIPFMRPLKEGSQKGRELVGQRAEKSLTFQNKDGTYTKRLYVSPVNYKDADGKWQKIDTSIATKGSKLEVTKAPYKLYFSSSSTDALAFKVDNKSLKFTPKDISYAKAKISGSKATYIDTYTNTDLERIATSTGLKQNYILKAAGHPTTFTETLNTSLTVKVVG